MRGRQTETARRLWTRLEAWRGSLVVPIGGWPAGRSVSPFTGGKPPAWDDAEERHRRTGRRRRRGRHAAALEFSREVDDRHCGFAGLYFPRCFGELLGFDGRELHLSAPAVDVAQQLVL